MSLMAFIVSKNLNTVVTVCFRSLIASHFFIWNSIIWVSFLNKYLESVFTVFDVAYDAVRVEFLIDT